MRRPFAAVAVLGTATAVFSLAGCGSSTSPAQTSFKSLSSTQQASVEDEAVVEVEANISSFATFNPTSGLLFAKVASRRTAGAAQIVRGKIGPRPRFQTSGSCETVTGNNADGDADGVPVADTATLACGSSTSGDSTSETGTVTFGDPTPNTADLEYNAGVNLTIAQLSASNGDENATLTAQSALTQATGMLSELNNSNLNLAITNAPNSSGNGSVKLKTNSNASYTYTGADPTSFGELPDGTFNLTGNWSFNVNSSQLTANLSFTISTPGGLSIMASCQNNDGHIDSGEIDIKFGDGTLVKAVYTACPSTPSITVS